MLFLTIISSTKLSFGQDSVRFSGSFLNSSMSNLSVLQTFDEDKPKRFIPAPTKRNFAVVVAPLGGIFLDQAFGYTGQLSAHFYKPAFSMDFYYEMALQDWFRKKMVDENEYLLVDHFFHRYEFNFALTFSSKTGKKNSLFYHGTEYYGGSAYDLYKSGTGNAAKYRQIRLGFQKLNTAIASNGLDSFPTQLSNGQTWSYTPSNLLLFNNNLYFHLGLGSYKVYLTESPGRSYGIDRIGVRKMYFDLFYCPSIDYHFLTEDGNSNYHGYLVQHVKQNLGGRIGWEITRLNPFSGYYQIEFGILPGIYPYRPETEGSYLIYASLKFGLASGWPLFNRNYN